MPTRSCIHTTQIYRFTKLSVIECVLIQKMATDGEEGEGGLLSDLDVSPISSPSLNGTLGKLCSCAISMLVILICFSGEALLAPYLALPLAQGTFLRSV